MPVKKSQLDDYYWVVQWCLVKFHGQTSLDAQKMVAKMRSITLPEADDQYYHEMAPWQMAGCWLEGKEALTPEEQKAYSEIIEQFFGEV